MSKICEICGKRPVAGRTICRRGLAKKKGGVGQKITGINQRRFIPNLQMVRAVINGAPKRIRVCVKCIKAGKVTKAAKRTFKKAV
ncbi:MAG: 50S ribosomal protein L28 [Candidatus Omnitrophota bacterium]